MKHFITKLIIYLGGMFKSETLKHVSRKRILASMDNAIARQQALLDELNNAKV